MTVRLRLDLSYDGSGFSGWATQPGLRTVQETLEHWVRTVLRLPEPVAITCAGRTDAGVHARGQVAHLDLDPTQVVRPGRDDGRELTTMLQRRLARALPDDIVVHRVSSAPDGFDARFAATGRHYCYRIWDHAGRRDPLLRGTVAMVNSELDAAAMNDAATPLLGLHDFAAFCRRREGATTIRTLTGLTTSRIADGERAGTIEVEVRADAFCHSMVRSLVGALVAVGSHRRDADWLAGLVTRTERSGEVTVMPAHGLTLEGVDYPPDAALAERVAVSRTTRELP